MTSNGEYRSYGVKMVFPPQITSLALLQVHRKLQLLALGDDHGMLTILEVPLLYSLTKRQVCLPTKLFLFSKAFSLFPRFCLFVSVCICFS